MCIAILKRSRKTISDETLRTCWINNPDGGGFMYEDNGKLIVRKGYMKFDSFLAAYKKIPDFKNKEIGIHFRIATHGTVCPSNTHPFWIERDHSALVHNGILSFCTPTKGWDISDSEMFVYSYLCPLLEEFPGFLESAPGVAILEEAIGFSKMIIMRAGLPTVILNEYCGEEFMGNWFSNRTFVTFHRSGCQTYYDKDRSFYTSRGYRFDPDRDAPAYVTDEIANREFDSYEKGVNSVWSMTDEEWEKYQDDKTADVLPTKRSIVPAEVCTESVDEIEPGKVYICPTCRSTYFGDDTVFLKGNSVFCPECGEELD